MSNYLKISQQTYQGMLDVLGERKFKEVFDIYQSLVSNTRSVNDGLLIHQAAIQVAVDFMHRNCFHFEVHVILRDILSAKVVDLKDNEAVDDTPIKQSRKAPAKSTN